MAKKEEAIIKNPTAEELEQLKKVSSTSSFRKEENSNQLEQGTVGEFQSEYVHEYEHLIKKKTNFFEPDPIPFKLPSGKHVVDNSKLTNEQEIFIRRFSAPEEKHFQRAKDSGTTNESINKALDAIIKTEGVKIEDLSLVDKLALFIYAIAISYGSKIDIADKLDCKQCVKDGDHKTKVYVDILKDLEIRYVPDDYEYPFKVKINSYKGCDITQTLHYPLISEEFLFADDDETDVLEAVKVLTDNIEGTKPNGNKITKQEWNGILQFLSIEDRIAVREKIQKFSEFGIQLSTDKYTCTNKKCMFVADRVKINIGLDVLVEKMLKSTQQSKESAETSEDA